VIDFPPCKSNKKQKQKKQRRRKKYHSNSFLSHINSTEFPVLDHQSNKSTTLTNLEESRMATKVYHYKKFERLHWKKATKVLCMTFNMQQVYNV